ncbi:MAG: sarcosine oxidase subunit gamma [Sphingorhabdus sp.]
MAELTRLPDVPMFAIRCRNENLATLPIVLPTTANRFAVVDNCAAIWMSPDEWLLIDEDASSEQIRKVKAAASGQDIAVVDVSGNRVRYRLQGEGAAALLAKGCSLDFHPDVFATGQCAGTMLARAQIILLKRDDYPIFEILPRRSFAYYLESWFDAAR